MSSIYRKGRDGYFYYQKYLKNSKTGKKDKKIFHSLGTKDRNIAIQKQIEFDRIYEEKKSRKKNSFLHHIKGTGFLRGALILILMIIVYMKYASRHSINSSTKIRKNFSETVEAAPRVNDLDSSEYQDSLNIVFSTTKEQEVSPTIKNQQKEILDIVDSIPTYSIIREEKIDNNFRQIKIHLLINKNTKKNNLFLISKGIKSKYPDFSNIIICFYSDELEGEKMAKEGMQSFNSLQKQNLWLAMYSYNKVEGEYFDDNPAGYLGAY